MFCIVIVTLLGFVLQCFAGSQTSKCTKKPLERLNEYALSGFLFVLL